MKTSMLGLATRTTLFLALLQSGNAGSHLVSDFDDGVPDWRFRGGTIQEAAFVESDGQLVMSGWFPATQGNMANSFAAVGWGLGAHQLRDGQTIDFRVDLVSTSRADVLAGIELVFGSDSGGYALMMNGQGVYVDKVYWGAGLVFARLFYEPVTLPTGNVVLAFAVTRVGDSLQLTGRVLDKSNHEAVLFERTVIDTPEVDPTVSEFPGITNLQPDPGAPFFRGVGLYLHLDQISDGEQPTAEVVYDNLTYADYGTIPLIIERQVNGSMELAWPTLPTPLSLQEAPTVEGPWTDVIEWIEEFEGTNYLSLPAVGPETMRVFRLIEASDP